MIVSWDWLKQYVLLDMPAAELEQRLMMAGLNHEETVRRGDDLAIDLEVTSNRPDCLGHLGIAREIAVLWGRPLTIPPAQPAGGKTPIAGLMRLRIDCPELCSRYIARVIRGVKIGPSPAWMRRRLEAIGVAPINNVVDISNYVLMECGQPLHTFDFAKLQGPEIIVRRGRPGETIEAIDHKTYRLDPQMCVIADADDAVAIAGVMGGAATEISAETSDLLIEAAEFDPMSIRSTARRLNLHSDSSYRFERRIDPEGIDWASRRCAELILDVAGGELAAGLLDVGQPPPPRRAIVLRFSQLRRILGIDVEPQRVREILVALGNVECQEGLGIGDRGLEDGKRPGTCDSADLIPNPQSPIPVCRGIRVVPPSWRRDLTREIDLIEEVARIHGYDKIPEDVGVPMVPSARSREDRVLAKVRQVMTAAGFDEALSISVVDEATSAALSPWTAAPPLRSLTPVLRGADRLRRSLIPSLLGVRRTNEALANAEIELFEIAKVYLPRGHNLPSEERMLGISSGRDFPFVKGVIEAILAALRPTGELRAEPCRLDMLDGDRSCQLLLGDELLGFVGRLSSERVKQFDLRGGTTVAEVKLRLLIERATLVPHCTPLSAFPAVTRDLNLVVEESVRWADVAATVRAQCGRYFENLAYRDTYHDEKRLGPGKKSLLLSIALRWDEGTMTNQQADAIREQILAACRQRHGAELRMS